MAVARCSICILSVSPWRNERGKEEKRRSVRVRGNKTGPSRNGPPPGHRHISCRLMPRCHVASASSSYLSAAAAAAVVGDEVDLFALPMCESEAAVFAKQRDCRWTWASKHELSGSIEIDTATVEQNLEIPIKDRKYHDYWFHS